jgi:hypothetical protein
LRLLITHEAAFWRHAVRGLSTNSNCRHTPSRQIGHSRVRVTSKLYTRSTRTTRPERLSGARKNYPNRMTAHQRHEFPWPTHCGHCRLRKAVVQRRTDGRWAASSPSIRDRRERG